MGIWWYALIRSSFENKYVPRREEVVNKVAACHVNEGTQDESATVIS